MHHMPMVPGGRVIGLDISGTFGGGMRGALVDVAGSLIARKDAVTPRISQEDLIGNLVTMASPSGTARRPRLSG